ncbi:MAG: hypothetical protein SOR57_01970 [Parabacteroides sp.]|nr:hypothetical protein [Parabacteroides sp.]
MKEYYPTVICILISILVIISGSVGYVFYRYTLIEWWLPVVIALIPAILTLRFYKSWSVFAGISNKYIGMICHIICVGVVSYMLFIVCNYRFRDVEDRQEANVSVGKYSQEHEQRYKKRKHYYKTNKVKRYYLVITFDDARTKTIVVSKDKYDSIKGNNMKISLEKGLFGFTVFDL